VVVLAFIISTNIHNPKKTMISLEKGDVVSSINVAKTIGTTSPTLAITQPPSTSSPTLQPTQFPTLQPTLQPVTPITHSPTSATTQSCTDFAEDLDTGPSGLKRFPWDKRSSFPLQRMFSQDTPVYNVLYLDNEVYGLTCNQLMTVAGFLHYVVQVRLPQARNIAFSPEISKIILTLDLGYLSQNLLNSVLLNCVKTGDLWSHEHYVHGGREITCDAYSPSEENSQGKTARQFTHGIKGYVDEMIRQEPLFKIAIPTYAWSWPFVVPSLRLRKEVEMRIFDLVHQGELSRRQSLLISVHHRNFLGNCLEYVKGATCTANKDIVCDYQLSKPQVTKIFNEMPQLQKLTNESTNVYMYFSSDGEMPNHMVESNLDPRLKIKYMFTNLGKCFAQDRLKQNRDFLAILWTFALSDVHFENPFSSCGGFVFMWRGVFGSDMRGIRHEKDTMFPPRCLTLTNGRSYGEN
jgi:hypothetical protein